MLRRHRSTGECFGGQSAQLKVIPKKGLGVGMLDLEMLPVAAFSWRANFVQPSRSTIHARSDAVVAIAPVAAAKAKAPPVAVDVPAPWSDRQAGIGEPLIAGGVDAAIDFAPAILDLACVSRRAVRLGEDGPRSAHFSDRDGQTDHDGEKARPLTTPWTQHLNAKLVFVIFILPTLIISLVYAVLRQEEQRRNLTSTKRYINNYLIDLRLQKVIRPKVFPVICVRLKSPKFRSLSAFTRRDAVADARICELQQNNRHGND